MDNASLTGSVAERKSPANKPNLAGQSGGS